MKEIHYIMLNCNVHEMAHLFKVIIEFGIRYNQRISY